MGIVYGKQKLTCYLQKTLNIPQKTIFMEDDQLGLRRDTSNRTACTLAKVVKQFADTRNRQNCTLAKSVKKISRKCSGG